MTEEAYEYKATDDETEVRLFVKDGCLIGVLEALTAMEPDVYVQDLDMLFALGFEQFNQAVKRLPKISLDEFFAKASVTA